MSDKPDNPPAFPGPGHYARWARRKLAEEEAKDKPDGDRLRHLRRELEQAEYVGD